MEVRVAVAVDFWVGRGDGVTDAPGGKAVSWAYSACPVDGLPVFVHPHTGARNRAIINRWVFLMISS